MAATGISLIPAGVFSRPYGNLSHQEARYYTKLSDHRVQCELCPWKCIVEPGRRGHCEVRENQKGTYYSLVYGRLSSHHNDPIEKKPLYHVMPGSTAFSIATAGCNVDCKFCQNWELAQRRPEEIPGVLYAPEDVVSYARQTDCESIAFTYNEPTIFTEFIVDVGAIAKQAGIKSAMISNGFINKEPLLDLCRVIDAYKVDLKAFTESYYSDVVGGRLQPVLDTLKTLKEQEVWTEIVYLTVPTLNDDIQDIDKMTKWIYRELGPDVPLHFSRFHPKYRLRNLPPTPIKTLENAHDVAVNNGLHYVYLGNVPGHSAENTVCPGCKKTLIRRVAYIIYENHVKQGRCAYCGESIPGIWTA